LKHRFIRSARKTSYLTELIEKHKRWKAAGGDGSDSGSDDDMQTEYVLLVVVVAVLIKMLDILSHYFSDIKYL